MKQQRNILIGLAVIVLVAVAAMVLAVTSGGKKAANPMSSSASSSADTKNAVATTAVTIQNYMFSPMVIKVKAGATVTWTNKDGVQHNVVANQPSPDAPNGPLFAFNQTYSFTFKKAGTYAIHCAVHPYMHATVIVTQS
jgi:amicyanin